jgi:hypothetical protein
MAMSFQNDVIGYRSSLAANREVFLLNYREEFQAFSETDALLYRMAALLATAHAEAGHTHLSHVPLRFILKRQALNAFEAVSAFQGYQGWATLRPGIEAALVSGKWIEDPAIAQVWRDPEQHKTAYIRNYSGKGLVSSALPHSKEFHEVLNRINDLFVHTNYRYFEKHTRLQEVDAEHLFLQFTFNDDVVEHRAHLYAFLHLTRLLVHSLGEMYATQFSQHPELDGHLPKVQSYFRERMAAVAREAPENKETLTGLGLWPESLLLSDRGTTEAI